MKIGIQILILNLNGFFFFPFFKISSNELFGSQTYAMCKAMVSNRPGPSHHQDMDEMHGFRFVCAF